MKRQLWALAAVCMMATAACMPVTAPETGQSVTPATDHATPANEQTAAIACSGELTSRNQEGPYYMTGSPQRDSLIDPGMPGLPILIFGRVVNQDCAPIAGAKVDFWQTDAEGRNDNSGYTLRGHTIAVEDGAYTIETIEPAPYPGRPAHIHVKVFAPDGRELLTTQALLARHGRVGRRRAAPDLLIAYTGQDENGRQLAPFDFIVRR